MLYDDVDIEEVKDFFKEENSVVEEVPSHILKDDCEYYAFQETAYENGIEFLTRKELIDKALASGWEAPQELLEPGDEAYYEKS